MFTFASNFVFGLIRLFFSTAKAIYSFVAKLLFMTSLIVIVMAPGFFLLYHFKEENPLFIVYLAGALVWPFVVYAVVVAFLRRSRNVRTYRAVPAQYSNAADDFLYGSNEPFYSPLALVNSEIPYTNEHFAKYGSMD